MRLLTLTFLQDSNTGGCDEAYTAAFTGYSSCRSCHLCRSSSHFESKPRAELARISTTVVRNGRLSSPTDVDALAYSGISRKRHTYANPDALAYSPTAPVWGCYT
jgi:hypothetical protein